MMRIASLPFQLWARMIPLLLVTSFLLSSLPCVVAAASGEEKSEWTTKKEGRKILFVHQNFPAQFKHLAPALVEQGYHVSALMTKNLNNQTTLFHGRVALHECVVTMDSKTLRLQQEHAHPWIKDMQTKVIRGEACLKTAARLRDEEGYYPDVIVAHPGWGESLFVKDVWPQSRLGIYCELYYKAKGVDSGFDPEFYSNNKDDEVTAESRFRLRNWNNHVHFEMADAGISPTNWQASTFPDAFRNEISVIFDGIDTDAIAPTSEATLSLSVAATGQKVKLMSAKSRPWMMNNSHGSLDDDAQEVITFINRNLEPYRGFHIFMRALPELLRRRPNARVLIVGGTGSGYGAEPNPRDYDGRTTWREIFTDEVSPRLADPTHWHRVHFVGKLAHHDLITMLQLSTVHVYLTYPFVLSWSLIESMSAGCAIVASDTPPLREVITDHVTGRLVPFFDTTEDDAATTSTTSTNQEERPSILVETIIELLNDPEQRLRLGKQARALAKERYDLETICLPQQLAWIDQLYHRNASSSSSLPTPSCSSTEKSEREA